MHTELTWSFPITRPHAGALLGNGTQGLMLWGEGQDLIITVGHAGFWDHRWGNDFTAVTTYADLRHLLESGDNEGLAQTFGKRGDGDKSWHRPQQMSCGRVQVHLPDGWRLQSCVLSLAQAEMQVQVASDEGATAQIQVRQAVEDNISWITLPEVLADDTTVAVLPAWEQPGCRAAMERIDIQAPSCWADDLESGFLQTLPSDDPLAMVMVRHGGIVTCGTAVAADAKDQASALAHRSVDGLDHERSAWWSRYWSEMPSASFPDAAMQELFDYGLFKQACSTPAHGVACTLQGPFLEDYQLPPWSCDYHFNINLQMIYWPALATGAFSHFDPLWDMIRDWWDRLRVNAGRFFKADEAFMLPHAVDDRCQAVGTFWTGCIDHGCTAWMAHMAWLHYRYSQDRGILEDMAWPMLRGAFEGYWAMLVEESGPNGEPILALPVSVSPEFKGAEPDAWGRNASFQLAAAHAVVNDLIAAAEVRGVACDERWLRVRRELPPYTVEEHPVVREHEAYKHKRIVLWEGMDLITSHRHHSHLASVYPFTTVDPSDATHSDILQNSFFHWTRTGPGAWSGWCVPWAANLHARMGQGDAAVTWLQWWRQVFVNEGRGTLHDAQFPGHSTLASQGAADKVAQQNEVMQLDAGFGALSCLIELLVQCRGSSIHILPSLPEQWQDCQFDGIHAEGGFVVGATMRSGSLLEVRVRAVHDGVLTLHHGQSGCSVEGTHHAGPELQRVCQQGDQFVLAFA